MPPMKLAIAADWLVTYGGAERTVAEFLKIWPGSPLFTTVAHPANLGPLRDADIRTTRLQTLYNLMGKHQLLLPLMPRALEDIDLSGYDTVLSSSHAVAKGIVPPDGAVHVCYCHTPMRYAWEMEKQYLQDFRVPKFLQRRVRAELSRLRRWDLTTAKRVDVFIANSTETQDRISRIYGRESVVIHPPADGIFLETPLAAPPADAPFLAVGRFVPYKRFDLLIEIANARKLPLTIAGTGQDEKRLRAMAGPTVRFAGFVPETELPALYTSARALLFPPYEDAGIVPLEAQATGRPVIAYARGGARDTVIEGETGTFFAEQTAASLGDALDRFGTMRFDHAAIRAHAAEFSSQRFRAAIKNAVEEARRTFGVS